MPTRYSPVRHCQGLPQPCDLHVLSMPPAFALSQDQTLRFISTPSHTAKAVQPAISTNRPSTHLSQDPSIILPLGRTTDRLTSVTVTHQKDTTATPHTQATGQQSLIEPSTSSPSTKPRATHVTPRRTPPTYPFLSLFHCQRAKAGSIKHPHRAGNLANLLCYAPPRAQTAKGSPPAGLKQETTVRRGRAGM